MNNSKDKYIIIKIQKGQKKICCCLFSFTQERRHEERLRECASIPLRNAFLAGIIKTSVGRIISFKKYNVNLSFYKL